MYKILESLWELCLSEACRVWPAANLAFFFTCTGHSVSQPISLPFFLFRLFFSVVYLCISCLFLIASLKLLFPSLHIHCIHHSSSSASHSQLEFNTLQCLEVKCPHCNVPHCRPSMEIVQLTLVHRTLMWGILRPTANKEMPLNVIHSQWALYQLTFLGYSVGAVTNYQITG